MTTRASDPTVSNIILRQLGGHRFLAMTGARDLGYDDVSLTMRLPRSEKGIVYVRVGLTPSDTYEIQGYNRKGKELDGAYLDDVCCDSLQAAFTALTGLAVRL